MNLNMFEQYPVNCSQRRMFGLTLGCFSSTGDWLDSGNRKVNRFWIFLSNLSAAGNPVCKENQPYLSFFHMDEDIPIGCSIFMPEQPCKFLIPSLTKMDRSLHWWIEFIRFISSIAWLLRHLAWSCHAAKSVAAGRFGASIANMWFVCFCCFSSKDIFE